MSFFLTMKSTKFLVALGLTANALTSSVSATKPEECDDIAFPVIPKNPKAPSTFAPSLSPFVKTIPQGSPTGSPMEAPTLSPVTECISIHDATFSGYNNWDGWGDGSSNAQWVSDHDGSLEIKKGEVSSAVWSPKLNLAQTTGSLVKMTYTFCADSMDIDDTFYVQVAENNGSFDTHKIHVIKTEAEQSACQTIEESFTLGAHANILEVKFQGGPSMGQNNVIRIDAVTIDICDGEGSVPQDSPCVEDCGDGSGKVTGGGWILLHDDSDLTFNTDFCTSPNTCEGYGEPGALNNIKANYGFNAMYRKGKPEGSTNFDFEGAFFHFHSETQGAPLKYLEVIDDVHARWMGKGWLATKLSPKKNDWQDEFCYMVAVQDHGEPGYHDTWRIRIWYCGTDNNAIPTTCDIDNPDSFIWQDADPSHDFLECGSDPNRVVFDTNANLPLPKYEFPLTENANPETDGASGTLFRFNGTEVGEPEAAEDGAKGGGNIQIHKKKDNENDSWCKCECGDEVGKVTGGGWILLDSDVNVYFNSDWCQTGPTSGDCTSQFGSLDQVKANYGFNAMWRKGLPEGSTNFDIDGGYFHFHSATRSVPLNFLEVVDPIHARWMGRGSLSTALTPKKNDFDDDFCFMVAVQDHGEPGYHDTWRIRIWYCGSMSGKDDCAVDETPILSSANAADLAFINCGDDPDRLVFDTDPSGELPSAGFADTGDTADLLRFNGTEVGVQDAATSGAKGGGNIQIHLKNSNKWDQYCV